LLKRAPMHLSGIYLFDVYVPWWAGGLVVLDAATDAPRRSQLPTQQM
jgi:hypothetical protein